MFTWKFLELFANSEQLVSVTYLLSGTDGTNTVESKGKHTFSNGIVNKSLADIVESDLVQWLEKDTIQDDVNPIKLAIENQLKAIENAKKVDFPWLANTFTVE
jgi:hypothetical protein